MIVKMSKVDFKVVMLGHEYVGKTSLVERFIHQRFREDVPYQVTIGAVFIAKPVVSSTGKKIVLGLWDTAGSERYQAMSRIYYRGAKAAIVCYDVCNKVSWQRAKFWVSEIRKNLEDCKIYICGTKIDKVTEGVASREVELEEVEKYVTGILSVHFETSSKTGENVDKLFQRVVDEFVRDPGNTVLNSGTLQLHDDVQKRRCC